jgi:conjugative transfer signal peptidase TraF
LTLAALAAGWPARLRFNSSPCLPRGIYRLGDAGGARPGDLVLACPPAGFAPLALARRYLRPGPCPGGTKPIGKLLLAVAGDRLDVEAVGIAVNGRALRATATLAADSAGRALPHAAAGARRVAAGQVWLVAPHRSSLDSRYFGAVAGSQVLGRLTPLVVAGGADPSELAGEIRLAHGDPRQRPPTCRERRGARSRDGTGPGG